jgi:FKBP-type peptidyl-prolyl cis-trans isomerase 2
MKMTKYAYIAAAAAAVLTGCSKGDGTNSNDRELMYLEAWLQINYPDATASKNGIYVLSDEAGDGEAYNGENYVIVDFTIKSLDGTIVSTTSKATAQQIGSYDPSYYYGERVWLVADNSLQVGINDMIEDMSIGETKTALIPSWLFTTKRRSSASDYLDHTQDASSYIYTVTLRDFTDDIVAREVENCESYLADTMNVSIDTTSFGFWLYSVDQPDTNSFPTDTIIYINYVGRVVPGGHVFDTNIADSAKVYDLYSASTTYSATEVDLAEDYSSYTFGSEGSTMISGFAHAISLMHPYEHAITVFISPFGYGSSGSGSKIPPYASLRFDIWAVDEPDD